MASGIMIGGSVSNEHCSLFLGTIQSRRPSYLYKHVDISTNTSSTHGDHIPEQKKILDHFS